MFSAAVGGFTYYQPSGPPPVPDNTASWFAGGNVGRTSVNRITFATDTLTASVRGNLNYPSSQFFGTSNSTDGWVAGGSGTVSYRSNVNRITYATDTNTASDRGPLSIGKQWFMTAGNVSYGWYAGGERPATVSSIERITYANDTATSVSRGLLSLGRKEGGGAGTQSYGWWAGGYSTPGPVYTSIVDRTDYADDTATASVRGPLVVPSYFIGSAGNNDYGWFSIGVSSVSAPSPVVVSSIVRIDYANDTATASVRGPLTGTRTRVTGSGNNSYGYFAGGYAPGNVSTINRVDYANDTVTATSTGSLAATNRAMASVAGVQ